MYYCDECDGDTEIDCQCISCMHEHTTTCPTCSGEGIFEEYCELPHPPYPGYFDDAKNQIPLIKSEGEE